MSIPIALQVAQQRLNTSLHSDDANGALFALYISMLDTTHEPYQSAHVNNSPESSDSGLPPSAPKSAHYAVNQDYAAYQRSHQALLNAEQPDVIIRWHNSAHPQPLHHASEAILICDEVLENSPMYTQHRIKQARDNTYEYSHANTMTEQQSDSDGSQDYTALFDVIKQANNFPI